MTQNYWRVCALHSSEWEMSMQYQQDDPKQEYNAMLTGIMLCEYLGDARLN
jgi:hypothetical protein